MIDGKWRKYMLTINNEWVVSFDHLLPLDSMPDPHPALAESYDLVRWGVYGRQIDQYGNAVKDLTWAKNNGYWHENPWSMEVLSKARCSYYVLMLTEDAGYLPNSKNSSPIVYDSIETPAEVWDNITWRKDLPKEWDAYKAWVESLKGPVFEKIGRLAVLIRRPNAPNNYHRDCDRADECYPHRQEFAWINWDPEQTMYIMDDDKNLHKAKSMSGFFNHQNWHGSHESLPYWNFGLKIEGIFTEDFRKKAGINHIERYYYENV